MSYHVEDCIYLNEIYHFLSEDYSISSYVIKVSFLQQTLGYTLRIQKKQAVQQGSPFQSNS